METPLVEPYFQFYKGEEKNPYDSLTIESRMWNLEYQWALFKDKQEYIDGALELYSQERLEDFFADDFVPMEYKAYLLCRMLKSTHYIYSVKDFKKIYEDARYYNRNMFKYYKGEEKNPYPRNDARSNLWYGEMMFVHTRQSLKHWAEQGKQVIERLEYECEDEKVASAKKYTKEEFGIIVYIETLFEKWCPYDSLDWIFKY